MGGYRLILWAIYRIFNAIVNIPHSDCMPDKRNKEYFLFAFNGDKADILKGEQIYYLKKKQHTDFVATVGNYKFLGWSVGEGCNAVAFLLNQALPLCCFVHCRWCA